MPAPAASTNPRSRDRLVRRMRRVIALGAVGAVGGTAALAAVAAHAFKGHARHEGVGRGTPAARPVPRTVVPPPQHVPAIADAPAPLQPPSAPPAAAPDPAPPADAPAPPHGGPGPTAGRARAPAAADLRGIVTTAAVARWRALGTTAAVAVTDESALADARRAVQRELDAIDAACSRFRADSMLTRLNGAPGRWVRVGSLLAEAIAVALRAAAVTDGAVDPTVGRALIRAGYDRDFDAGLSVPAAPVTLARVPGWQVVDCDTEGERARIPDGVRLDLGATAKALAADRAAAAAVAAAASATGCAGCGVLVNLGGDIAVAGPVPPGGWPVRVTDDHRDADDPSAQRVAIGAGGLATSSTTARRWGPVAHHIVDPATGRPSTSRWRTVSVAAASCVDANVASTASIVVGEDAPAWLSARALPARLVAHDGAVTTVAGWPPQAGER